MLDLATSPDFSALLHLKLGSLLFARSPYHTIHHHNPSSLHTCARGLDMFVTPLDDCDGVDHRRQRLWWPPPGDRYQLNGCLNQDVVPEVKHTAANGFRKDSPGLQYRPVYLVRLLNRPCSTKGKHASNDNVSVPEAEISTTTPE
ncbi:hypothetical protein quinque_013668 [Culex quinquefasciatus]